MRVVHHLCKNLPIVGEKCVVSTEIERIDRRTAQAWAKGMSVDEYLRRERFLKTRPFSQGLTVHALLDDNGDIILASCETYRVPVTIPGRTTPGFGVGIASVFVDENQRGHGYAAELMRLLHRELADEGAALCYLMSEIGPTLYARLGYVTCPLRLRRYAAKPPTQTTNARLFTESELPRVLLELAPPLHSPLHIPPTVEQLDWHLSRGRFVARLVGQQFPAEVGAQSGSAVAVWEPDLRPNVRRLRILLLAATTASPNLEDVSAVLDAATALAHRLEVPVVEVWESAALEPLLEGGVVHKADDVPMMLPLASDVVPTDFRDCQRYHWL